MEGHEPLELGSMCQEKKEISFSIYYRHFIAELLKEAYVAVIFVAYLVDNCIWV